MSKTTLIVLATAMLVCTSSFAGDKVVSDSRSRTDVFVTVYNNDLALIRDVRTIELDKGKVEVEFRDVAENVIPETVVTKPLDKGSLTVLEQNYEYDLLNPQRLIEKYVGGQLRLVKENPKTGDEKRVDATLLSSEGGGVFKTENGITFGNVGRLEVPTLPDNFVSHPTLRWILENGSAGKRKIETSYLSEGMSWKADYVLLLDDADIKADLNGWVTLNNESGTGFENATLSLVAGKVNRITRKYARSRHRLKADIGVSSGQKGFKEEGLFEYHLYTLGRPTTIANRQQKQVSLLEASGIKVRRLLKIKPSYARLTTSLRTGDSNKQPVEVYIEFNNRKKDGLGMPLPGGVVRVYKADSKGGRQFLGEDSVGHTPENEKVTVKVGNAFDVVAERRQLDYKKIADGVYQTSWEIKIRNHKKEKITVEVEEPMTGDWEVLKSSHKASRKDATTLGFVVKVKPGDETIVTFKIQTKK